MDAYIPAQDTVAPHAMEMVVSGWRSRPITQSNFKFTVMLADNQRGNSWTSSEGRMPTYAILALPPLAGLERLRSFADFPENWNGEGGARPDRATVDAATKVYGLLAAVKLPQVSLNSLGQPMFLYDGACRGEIVVTSADTLDYYFDDDDAPCGDDVAFQGQLPLDVIRYIRA